MLLSELYQEEKGSSFTHDGKKYDLNKIFKLMDHQKVGKVDVKDLEWEVEDKLDPSDDDRVNHVSIEVPILYTKWKDKIVTVDGYHRVIRALKDGKKTLPAKYVTPEMLAQALIK